MAVNKILFFDTETTGFPRPKEALELQPHIVQLGYVFAEYDPETFEISVIEEGDNLVNPGVPIPEEVSKIHGITDERVANEPAFDRVAGVFFRYALQADLIVGHNVDFDYKMVRIEAARHWPDEKKREAFLSEFGSKMVCTMQSSIKLCKLPFPSGRAGYKWPKLQELHEHLFGQEFENAHDAKSDIDATLKCFVELHKKKLITV